MNVTFNRGRPMPVAASWRRARTRQVLAAIGTTALASTLIATVGPLPGASARYQDCDHHARLCRRHQH